MSKQSTADWPCAFTFMREVFTALSFYFEPSDLLLCFESLLSLATQALSRHKDNRSVIIFTKMLNILLQETPGGNTESPCEAL